MQVTESGTVVALFVLEATMDNEQVLDLLYRRSLRSATRDEALVLWGDPRQELPDTVCDIFPDGWTQLSAHIPDINPERSGNCRYELLELPTDNPVIRANSRLAVVALPAR